LLLHLLNYDPQPVAGVRLHVKLGRGHAGDLPMFTPDAAKCVPRQGRRAPGELEFTLNTLDSPNGQGLEVYAESRVASFAGRREAGGRLLRGASG
jgi:hypothetical protein